MVYYFTFTITTSTNKVRISFERFLSIVKKESAYIYLTIEMLEGSGTVTNSYQNWMEMFKTKTATMMNIFGMKLMREEAVTKKSAI